MSQEADVVGGNVRSRVPHREAKRAIANHDVSGERAGLSVKGRPC